MLLLLLTLSQLPSWWPAPILVAVPAGSRSLGRSPAQHRLREALAQPSGSGVSRRRVSAYVEPILHQKRTVMGKQKQCSHMGELIAS